MPRQCEHWLAMTAAGQSETRRETDCHASDVGHWFAMTTLLGGGLE